ncbi:uncharacterized protein N7483_007797 [Penicillium malachiteum]|uniref:uncharacterized protein n=1 Tax=Penicillium malachiteum TaxID=1324776 RepID=UPI00254891DF|nr:uncharacterized protein N7483_007797 [Penicillium malachiteum]KAJ5726440.1 hypothetical protein N7483_007797 [Penicillium malachiteum]
MKNIRFRYRNITPNQPIISPQFTNSGLNTTDTKLQDLMLGDNGIDDSDDSDDSHSLILLKRDWEDAASIVRNTCSRALTTSDHDVPATARAVAEKKGALCDLNMGFSPDMTLYDELFCPQTNWRAVLTNIYWGSFRQAAIWHIYLHLLAQGLIKAESLILPINLLAPS